MIRLRFYKESDAGTILSWCQSEKEFYQWTAGVMGEYPLSETDFQYVKTSMPFTAFDEDGIVGFFILRSPGQSADELRFGFVIVDPKKRGKGCGKEMLRLGLTFAFDIYHAKTVSLGVFENNLPAYRCYKAAGFRDDPLAPPEFYPIMGEDWKCLVMMTDRKEAVLK